MTISKYKETEHIQTILTEYSWYNAFSDVYEAVRNTCIRQASHSYINRNISCSENQFVEILICGHLV